MNEEIFIKLAKAGESTQIEYKTCTEKISESLYETICSFLNHSGGRILLGVKDNGKIIGVNPDKVEILKTNIVTSVEISEIVSRNPEMSEETSEDVSRNSEMSVEISENVIENHNCQMSSTILLVKFKG